MYVFLLIISNYYTGHVANNYLHVPFAIAAAVALLSYLDGKTNRLSIHLFLYYSTLKIETATTKSERGSNTRHREQVAWNYHYYYYCRCDVIHDVTEHAQNLDQCCQLLHYYYSHEPKRRAPRPRLLSSLSLSPLSSAIDVHTSHSLQSKYLFHLQIFRVRVCVRLHSDRVDFSNYYCLPLYRPTAALAKLCVCMLKK